MTIDTINSPASATAAAYALLVAEEELILQAQMLIQRTLNTRKMSQKELARKLGVGDSYISQMLGDSARNLTLRTIARVLHALGLRGEVKLGDPIDFDGSNVTERIMDDVEVTAASAPMMRSDVWDVGVALKPRRKGRARRPDDARAYASGDPPCLALAA